MPEHFDKIGLIGKFGDKTVTDTLTSISTFLEKQGRQVWLDEDTANNLVTNNIATLSRKQIGQSCDLVIVIGGDGTLLDAARSLAGFDIPLLGINLGRLGFLVDISRDNLEKQLQEILDGHYTVEERSLLYCEIERNGRTLRKSPALNDIVIHKWEVARMIEYTTHIDGKLVHHHRSDGLIVSTPTGSTAYALSGGGPIVHPSVDATLMVPICPHTLSNRPIVIPSDSDIEIKIGHSDKAQAQVTWDGQIHQRVHGSDVIRISSFPHKLRLLHPKDHDYYQVLRAKLHWSEHP